MGDTNRNSIVFIIAFDRFLNLQKKVNHVRDLFLVGLSIAGRRVFDFSRRVFANRNTSSLGSVQDGAAYFGDLHGGFCVVVEEEPFKCDSIGAVDCDEAFDFVGNLREALGERRLCRGFHTIRVDIRLLSAVFLEDGDAASAESGVYGEYLHGKSVSRGLECLYTSSMHLHIWRGLVTDFLSVCRGKNLLWHVLAIGVTAVLVLSGADWQFFEATRLEILYWPIMIAGIGGFFMPVLVPLGMYLWGEFAHRPFLMMKGAAVGRAVIIAYVVSIIYKALTGREEPEFLTTFSLVDNSRAFDFGFLEYGVFWGWPSSHAAVAFALSFTLIFLTRSLLVRIPAAVYAIFIGFGAAVGFHWLSDVLAGAILGLLVATVVSHNFRVN